MIKASSSSPLMTSSSNCCRPSAVSEWSSLANDLLIDILGRLNTLHDFFAFRGVCRNWRSAAKPSPSTLSSQYPLLIAVTKKRTYEAVYDFVSLCRYSLRLPWTSSERYIVSCSHGHLITYGCSSNDNIHLWDIFTGATILLPQHRWTASQVILSARPDSARCQAVLFRMRSDKFYYLNVGDTSWTTVSSPQLTHVTNMWFLQGQLLGLTVDMELLALELNGDSLMVHKLGGRFATISNTSLSWLGESDGVLLAGMLPYRSRLNYSPGFRVFKWNSDNKGWEEMYDLGDKALFANHRGDFVSMKVSSTGLGIKKNCVYYLDSVRLVEFSFKDKSYNQVIKVDCSRFCDLQALVFPRNC